MVLKFKVDNDNIFYRIVEDSTEAIMITNLEGKLEYVNPAWSRVYGFTKDEAIGNSPRLLHSGHQKPEFYRDMWAEISNPDVGFWKGEVINRAKDGHLVPVLLTITPYRDHEKAIRGYMGMAIDLSQKKDLEARIMHQDRLASVGMLASGLAHEIGTPLGVIRGRAEFLAMQSKEEPVRNGLGVIVSQIDRISRLIQALLKISRGTGEMRIETVSPCEVFHEVSALLEKDVKVAGIELIDECPPEIRVDADFSRLEQIILNFTMNAIHAIKKAEKEQSRKGPHSIRFKCRKEGRKTIMKVIDTGSGITPENMKKLFTPFFTTKDVGEGTGLGLAIVAQLVHEMKGEISVTSEVGKGTTFTVVF